MRRIGRARDHAGQSSRHRASTRTPEHQTDPPQRPSARGWTAASWRDHLWTAYGAMEQSPRDPSHPRCQVGLSRTTRASTPTLAGPGYTGAAHGFRRTSRFERGRASHLGHLAAERRAGTRGHPSRRVAAE
ncbi:hypothetical protein DB30_07520 [Enhygromyxa salina]|uniref:Uncharacterized protein n=1 Tax=Enhygromyxa salina TaxID=215803 RepID=A0A0C2D0Y8_9BACT|nr:hypothetical protein DB30_07520 [Enhygromyxa salina]